MANVIVLLLIVFAVGAALNYIRKEKKKGRRCIGCPSSGTCNCTCDNNHKPKNSNN